MMKVIRRLVSRRVAPPKLQRLAARAPQPLVRRDSCWTDVWSVSDRTLESSADGAALMKVGLGSAAALGPVLEGDGIHTLTYSVSTHAQELFDFMSFGMPRTMKDNLVVGIAMRSELPLTYENWPWAERAWGVGSRTGGVHHTASLLSEGVLRDDVAEPAHGTSAVELCLRIDLSRRSLRFRQDRGSWVDLGVPLPRAVRPWALFTGKAASSDRVTLVSHLYEGAREEEERLEDEAEAGLLAYRSHGSRTKHGNRADDGKLARG